MENILDLMFIQNRSRRAGCHAICTGLYRGVCKAASCNFKNIGVDSKFRLERGTRGAGEGTEDVGRDSYPPSRGGSGVSV